MSSSRSTRHSSRPRDGKIREQRPDAALDVLGAGLREHGCDHEAHSHTQRGQLRERVSYALSNRALQPGGRSGNTTIQSRRVHDRGKPSRAKPGEVQNAVCGTDLRGKDSNDEAFPATRKSGPHVARRNPRPCRRQGGQPSSGIISLHAQCFHRVGLGSPRPRVARESVRRFSEA